ncbi:hypothetical protein MTO96_010555 [Rhipicephalus appendiculatus]
MQQQPRTEVAGALGQDQRESIMSKTPTKDSESAGAILKAGTSQGLRYLAEGLATIADALNYGGPGVRAASRPSCESQRSVDVLPDGPGFRCGSSFSEETGEQYDRCRHKRPRDPTVVITLSDSDETDSNAALQNDLVDPEGSVVGKRSLSDGPVDAVDTAAEISAQDDWFDEGERGLVFDLVLESPMYAEEEFRVEEKFMPESSRARRKVRGKDTTSKSSRADRKIRRKDATSKSSRADRKSHRKDATCQADTAAVRSVEPKQSDSNAASQKQGEVGPADSEVNQPEEEGGGDENVEVPAQQSFPPRDVFQKIEDLPAQRAENVAAAPPTPSPTEPEVVVGYEAMWTVTAVLVIMAIVVLASVATEYYLYREEGTTDATSPKATSSRTSNIHPTARLLTTENRTRRIFVFMSEEETKAGDTAILEVNDET